MTHSVCIFGDSVSKGVIFDAAKNKYRLLKDSFSNLMERHQNIAIANYARFGCTISMGNAIMNRYESKLESLTPAVPIF